MSPPDDAPDDSSDETRHWGPPESIRDLTNKTLGDFHVERLIGRGGMGEVYLARQISLNRSVALKVLRPDLLTRPTYLSRFEAEAAAVAKLNHPNIVHVYTLGSVDGIRFIAMEYVQGTNLKDYLRKKTWLDYPLALSIMRQAALAVGAAGEIGLVHRDIKPENLLLTKKGQVKITDFGLCRDLGGAERMTLTQPGVTMGTPMYMSPEQAQGQALDHRSDLYSLGVTFYHMIAGVPPFKADSVVGLAVKHVKELPASIAVHRPDVPPELDRIVLKLLAKSPTDRYQSAAEMLRDLMKAGDDEPRGHRDRRGRRHGPGPGRTGRLDDGGTERVRRRDDTRLAPVGVVGHDTPGQSACRRRKSGVRQPGSPLADAPPTRDPPDPRPDPGRGGRLGRTPDRTDRCHLSPADGHARPLDRTGLEHDREAPER
ncbi:MAG: serine/threonine-protein kinase [Isosphaeraceae bacterium]